jgi:hypothetical protein
LKKVGEIRHAFILASLKTKKADGKTIGLII